MKNSSLVPALFVALSATAAEEAAIELEPIQVTATRTDESAAAVPQSVTVVTPDQIERSTPQVMTDFLRGQPGVFTQSSGPGQGIAIIRGLKGSEVLHLVDGMRLNNSLFRNSPNQYIGLLDPYNVSRIEVMRGPAGTLYGSDAMGGVMQVITPEKRFHTTEWTADASAIAQYGGADLAQVSRIEGALGRDQFSFGAGFTYSDYNERRIADGGRQPFTSYWSRAADAKLIASPADGHEVMLNWQYFKLPKLPRYHEIMGGPGGAGSGEDLPIFFEPNDRSFLHARYRIAAPLPGVASAELHVARQRIDDDRNRLVDAITREDEQNRSRLSGVTLQAVSPVGASLQVHWGAELYRDDIDSSKARTDLETGASSVRAPTFPHGARQDSVGIYVDAEWTVSPTWRLDAGARYSNVKTDLTATVPSPAATLEDDDVTGHLGTVFRMTDRLSWTATVARGFRAPNLFDLGTLGPRAGTDPQQLNIPNPDLEPEVITSIDSGLRWRGAGIRLDGVAFYSRYKNRIEPREPTGNIIPNGTLGCTGTEENADCIEVQSRNISDARYWGVELGGRLRRGPIEGYAALNWTYGQELRPDGTRTPANRVPPFNGQVGLLYDLVGGFSFESYVLFARHQARLDDDDFGDVRIDPDGTAGWTTANLRLGWSPERRWRVQLSLINLFDHAYREHGSGIDAPGIGATLTAAARW